MSSEKDAQAPEKTQGCPDFESQVELELNTLSWSQIPVTSLARAQAFYQKLFGWQYIPLSAAQSVTDPTQESAYRDLGLQPDDDMFVMIRFRDEDPVPKGGFVLVTEENLISPAKESSKARLGVSVTITVRSIDETLKRIVEEGGKVYTEKSVIPGGMGCSAFFVDTEGNVMGLWSAT